MNAIPNPAILNQTGAKQTGAVPPQIKPINYSLLFGIVPTVILCFMVWYFGMPVFSLRYLGWPMATMFCLFPLLGVPKVRYYLKWVYFILPIYIILAMIFSSPLFNSGSYRKLLGKVESTNFTELISPIDLAQVPIVDRNFAAQLAEKKLGDDFALGSRVTLGWPTRQMVNGKLFWVVPLQHSGFFKWLANRSDGTPGYIMVSAINPQDIRFVRELNGRKVKIKYQENAFFGQNLHRHLYMHGFSNYAIGDYTFEVDEQGEPYWSATLKTNRVGVMGEDTYGLAMVHAETGKISYYPLKREGGSFSDANIPKWIDRIQPIDTVESQLTYWGKYVRGFWNTLFGKRDMLMVTEGYNIIYGRDNRSYFYTGMSSVGADEGTVGFVLIDTRTKKTHLYRMSGATEYAAMQSAEGKVQNFKYSATFPILVNMNGIPTYFMTLKDSAGLVKMFTFVSVKDFSLVGVGESVKSARENFQMALAGSRIGILPEGSAEKITLEGTVARIGTDTKDSRTYYYISLVEKPGMIYIATTNLSSYLPITQAGDRLRLVHMQSNEKELSLTELKNLSMEK